MVIAVSIASGFIFLTSIKQSQSPPVANQQNEEEKDYINKPINLNVAASSNYLTIITNIGMNDLTGTINCIVVSKGDSNHLLAGAANGGLWISNNRGTTWTIVNDFANSLKVSSIAQNHFRHNEYYYSTGIDIYNGSSLINDIYKSTDGGYTFTDIQPAT